MHPGVLPEELHPAASVAVTSLPTSQLCVVQSQIALDIAGHATDQYTLVAGGHVCSTNTAAAGGAGHCGIDGCNVGANR